MLIKPQIYFLHLSLDFATLLLYCLVKPSKLLSSSEGFDLDNLGWVWESLFLKVIHLWLIFLCNLWCTLPDMDFHPLSLSCCISKVHTYFRLLILQDRIESRFYQQQSGLYLPSHLLFYYSVGHYFFFTSIIPIMTPLSQSSIYAFIHIYHQPSNVLLLLPLQLPKAYLAFGFQIKFTPLTNHSQTVMDQSHSSLPFLNSQCPYIFPF